MATDTCSRETSTSESPKIRSNYCEINVAHHCNLSCRGCSHLSPIFSKEFADPQTLRRDLQTLSKFYHADMIRLLGGEPLLHPNVLEIIAIARESKIADEVRLCTNGLLLWEMPEEFWQGLDRVDVSVYPDREMTPKQLRICHQKARRWGTLLVLEFKSSFRESYSEVGTNDWGLIKRIYATCLIVHRWHCHIIERGYFFKCAQAVLLPRKLEGKFPSHHIDGLKIEDSSSFGEDLRAYLESPYPLAACRHCLGTVGKRFTHSQVKRSEWRHQFQQARLEDMVNMDLLAALERDLDGEVEPMSDETHVLTSSRQYLKYTLGRRRYREALGYVVDEVRDRSLGRRRAAKRGMRTAAAGNGPSPQ
jgi:hypothetical protein